MTTTVQHGTTKDRKAAIQAEDCPAPDARGARGGGKAARATVPRSVHGGWAPAADRPDPVALLEEQAGRACPSSCRSATGGCSCRRSRSSAARPTYGGRPGRRAADRPRRPALRRRAPVELRRVRRARPPARLQRQRLRRDAPGPVRVGRQAPRRELRGGRPRPRLRRGAAASRSTGPSPAPIARRCASFAGMRWTSGTRAWTSTRSPRSRPRATARAARGSSATWRRRGRRTA